MPAYFFHLAFEVYLSNPDLRGASSPLARSPCSDPDIFHSSLPIHTTSTWASYIAPRRTRSFATTGVLAGKRLPSTTDTDTTLIAEKSSSRPIPPSDLRDGLSVQTDSAHRPGKPEARHEKSTTDYRFDMISLESVDMQSAASTVNSADPSRDTDAASYIGPLGLKGKYFPSNPTTTELGYGVVHLYRDSASSPELEDESQNLPQTATNDKDAEEPGDAYVDNDCTTLCIPAVPAYMTPSDLLGWLGESTLELVSHFRLVRTARSNRYMTLMKFRDGITAKRWQQNWNGKLFNSMEPENCHIVFVKSIRFQTSETTNSQSSFPDMDNDPFTPAINRSSHGTVHEAKTPVESSLTSTSLTTNPVPPPSPALVELPTCPVCLERMDETNGLATIFCQHVFHCACLQKWQGNGCPVCRYTQNDHLHGPRAYEEEEVQCRVCGSSDNLWMCLICGHVGCGRYDEAHAFAHFEQTSHSFAMDLTTQVIWDYIGDEYVHRLIQNKADGKLVELPSNTAKSLGSYPAVPEEKFENMGMEYSNLLKGQLDSQRFYFEEQVDRAVDKASQATAAADEATAASIKATEQLEAIHSSHEILLKETLPAVEKRKERAEARAEKFETMARKMEKEWKEKEVINESLMDRIRFLEKQAGELTLKNSDLEEQNRDLSFFISGMEKLKDQGADVQEGTLEIGNAPSVGKKKKGKGKK